MATPEALVKYYECLKDSFNKIQDKQNSETTLINAALRPKICEEFAKSQEVLNSYLSYMQVFLAIYGDKFKNFCSEIIVTLFKENSIGDQNNNSALDATTKEDVAHSEKASKLHETIRAIIKDNFDLTNDLVLTLARAFPNIPTSDSDSSESFFTYLKNCLEVCKYIHGESLNTLVTKILEKITPPCYADDSEEATRIRIVSDKSYELLYKFLDQLEPENYTKITESILACFTQDFISPPWNHQLNYLIQYICASSPLMVDTLLDLMKRVLQDVNRPIGERTASMTFSSSLLARSKYVDLEKVLQHIECMKDWCETFLTDQVDKKLTKDSVSENVDAFRAAAISIFYLITQRFREMYEKETIDRLIQLDLNRLIRSPYKPLDFVERELRKRFNEVVVLYHIAEPYETEPNPNKRRKSELVSSNRLNLALPFEENPTDIPERVKPHFRHYYHHRNFTIIRE